MHIVNYVPQRLLTLQADVSRNWPEIMKEHEKQLYNIILFEPTSPGVTKVISYGTGYRDTPEFKKLLTFFVSANESTLEKLAVYLEEGKAAFAPNKP